MPASRELNVHLTQSHREVTVNHRIELPTVLLVMVCVAVGAYGLRTLFETWVLSETRSAVSRAGNPGR